MLSAEKIQNILKKIFEKIKFYLYKLRLYVIIYTQCICGSVDRVVASEAIGRGFESLQMHSFYLIGLIGMSGFRPLIFIAL